MCTTWSLSFRYHHPIHNMRVRAIFLFWVVVVVAVFHHSQSHNFGILVTIARATTARHGTAQLHEIPITHARDGHAHAPTQPPKLHLLISHRL